MHAEPFGYVTTTVLFGWTSALVMPCPLAPLMCVNDTAVQATIDAIAATSSTLIKRRLFFSSCDALLEIKKPRKCAASYDVPEYVWQRLPCWGYSQIAKNAISKPTVRILSMSDKKIPVFDHMSAGLIRSHSEPPSKGGHMPSQSVRTPANNTNPVPPANSGGNSKK